MQGFWVRLSMGVGEHPKSMVTGALRHWWLGQ